MTVLVVTRGLPASGKTTYAVNWVSQDPERRARLNRDDIRHMMYGVYWGLTYEQEKAVTTVQSRAAEAFLRTGTSVIVDDTNLRLKHARALVDIAVAANAEWEVVDFYVDPKECAARDADRRNRGERNVGEAVIMQMAARYGLPQKFLEAVTPSSYHEGAAYTYEADTSKPTAWMCDLDGTLALMGERSPFDWQRVGEDLPNARVIDVIDALYLQDDVVFLSGRDESCRAQTQKWLGSHVRRPEGVFEFDLFMRPEKDNRKDAVVKLELFREHVAPRFNVLGVFDDRDQVVEMWRSIGLTCFQVAPGAF